MNPTIESQHLNKRRGDSENTDEKENENEKWNHEAMKLLTKAEREDSMINSFFNSKNLTNNDKEIIESFQEKKITKAMLVKYIERKHKTLCRGKIHLVLVFLSPFWILHMFKIANSNISKTSVAITLFCSFFNFFASFLLHNFKWNPSQLFFIEKLDYFGIFLMISGSLLPVQFLLFEKKKLLFFLILQSLAVIFGFFCIFQDFFISQNRILRSSMYILTGFLHSLFLKDYFLLLNTKELFYLIHIAVLYIVGAVIYAIKKPSIIPGIIDFHEVFHFCCLGSAIFTFILDCSVIKRT